MTTTLDKVFVLNADGTPLYPTTRYAKVRKWLASGEAKRVKQEPFTIQFTEQKDITPKPLSLGIDPGSKHLGLSVTDENKEYIAVQVDVLEDESKRINKRREARRTHRSLLHHRKPRFDNRSRKPGWLPPSIQHKVDVEVGAVRLLMGILPIGEVHIEQTAFDTHVLKHGPKYGGEYANGPQKGFVSVRSYVLARDGHACVHCGGQERLQVHHIESRLIGGNAPDNLVTLCEDCHKAYHSGDFVLGLSRGVSSKHATQVDIVSNRLIDFIVEERPDCVLLLTSGCETAAERDRLGVSKSHAGDARVISGNGGALPCGRVWRRVKKRRHNRHYFKDNLLRGGVRKSNTVRGGRLFGFSRFDVVRYDSEECFVDSLRRSGYFSLRRVSDGSLVATSKEGAKQVSSTISWRKLVLLSRFDGFVSWKEVVQE